MTEIEHVPSPLPSVAVFDEEPSAADVAAQLAELIEELDLDPADIGAQTAVEQRVNGRWAVNDQAEAEWAMRKIAEAKIRLDEDGRLYRQFVTQINAWFRRVAGPHQATIAFFEDHLEDYGRRWIRTQKKSAPKSLPLPSGVVRTSTRSATASIEDKDAVLEWAREHEPTLVHEEKREWVLVSEVRDYVEPLAFMEPNDEGEPVLVWKVVHKVTKEPVPGMIVEAEHTTVKIVPEPP